MTKKYAVFTMDVETFTDTECVANSNEKVDIDILDGFEEYIKILDKHNIKSTLFTVGSLAPKIKDRLKPKIENGHRLALHSFEHIAPMNLSLDDFKAGVLKSKEDLSKLFNTDIIGFRAPYFSLDNERLDVLKELGFKYDSSRLNFLKARHTVALSLDNFNKISKNIYFDGDFFEFGLSKQKIFGKPFPISGGGYVRLGNWDFIKSVIKHYIKNNEYYVFYLHPFELTRKKIPRLKGLHPLDQYYLQFGINSYGKHIDQLISMLKEQNYEFVTFEELTEILNTNK